MVKFQCFIVFLFISVITVYSQKMNVEFGLKDSMDCTDIYYELYVKGVENSVVTYWSNPPQLNKNSKKYLDLICGLLSGYVCENKYIPILILIDEKGIPYCYSMIKINGKYPVFDNMRKTILDIVKRLRFVPAYQGEIPAKSFYILTARKDEQTNRWFFPESNIN